MSLFFKKQNHFKKERTSAFLLETVFKINRAIYDTDDIKKMMSDVLDQILILLECDRAYLVYPCDPNTKFWSVKMVSENPEYPGLTPTDNIPTDDYIKSIMEDLLANKSPNIWDLNHESRVPIQEYYQAKAQLSMAIYPKTGKPWAFGLHQCSYDRLWTDEDIKIFEEMGYLIAGALNNLLLLENLKKTEQELLGKIDELKKVNKIMVDREIKMAELKKKTSTGDNSVDKN